MTVYRITIADEEGVVVDSYSVSTVVDFDVEDPEDSGEFDYYFEANDTWEALIDLTSAIAKRISAYENQKKHEAKKISEEDAANNRHSSWSRPR